MKNKKQRLDGNPFYLKMTRQMEFDLDSYRREHNIESKSELIRQAINYYLDKDSTDASFKLQGLMKITSQITELNNALHVIFNYIREMHTNIIAYHPEIDSAMKEAALASAKIREDKFFNFFVDKLKNDPLTFEQMLARFYTTSDTEGKNT